MRIFIEVDRKDPLQGRAGNGRAEEPFHGWLDLLRVLTELIEGAETSELPDPQGTLARLEQTP